MKEQKRAKLMLSLSMIIFGTLGLFTRNISVTSGELALYRAVMAALLLVGYFLVTGQRIRFGEIKKELLLLLFSGMAMGVNWILLFEAYKHTTISIATLSYYFAPVIVMIVSPILFRERLTPKQIVCFVMSTVGMALIIGFEGAGGSNHFTGILLGLSAAVFYATVILLNKFIKNVQGIHRTFLQFLAAIVILVPYVLCTGGIHPEVFGLKMSEGGFSVLIGSAGFDTYGWICLLIVGFVHTGVNYCMYFSSLKELKGQEVAILSYLDPLVAVLISVLVLGESMTLMQLVGGILILGFTLWNETGKC